MSKHYPPAYFKYRKTHTTISISVSKEFKKQLDKNRDNYSYGDFVRKLIEDFNNTVSERVKNERKEIEDNVRNNEDNFKVTCSYCRKPMQFSSRDSNWLEVKKLLYNAFKNKNWLHTGCHNKIHKKREEVERARRP